MNHLYLPNIRLPKDLGEHLANEAAANDRTLHAEIIHRLKESLEPDSRRIIVREVHTSDGITDSPSGELDCLADTLRHVDAKLADMPGNLSEATCAAEPIFGREAQHARDAISVALRDLERAKEAVEIVEAAHQGARIGKVARARSKGG
jgi:hypothetical protein